MTARLVFKAPLAALALATLPSLATAEGMSCATPTLMMPDGRILESSIPNGSTFYLYFFTMPGRSYVVEFKNRKAPVTQSPAGGGFNAWTDPGVCTAPLTYWDLSTNVSPISHLSGKRISFTETRTGAPGLLAVEFSINNNTGITIDYVSSVQETTLYSPAWTTNGTFDTYWSFQNTVDAFITGTLTLLSPTGAIVTAVSVNIPVGGIFGTNTSTLGVARSKVGNAQFSHDGPAGAVDIKANQANFAVSPPFIELVPFAEVRAGR
jgi:hypothetical protein